MDNAEVTNLARVLLTYNLLVGLLLMVAGEKIGAVASVFIPVKKQHAARLTSLSCTTVGACLAVLSLIVLTLTYTKL